MKVMLCPVFVLSITGEGCQEVQRYRSITLTNVFVFEERGSDSSRSATTLDTNTAAHNNHTHYINREETQATRCHSALCVCWCGVVMCVWCVCVCMCEWCVCVCVCV